VAEEPEEHPRGIPNGFPGKVRTAGIIWILFGALILLWLLISFAFASPQDLGAITKADLWQIALVGLVGVGFGYAGFRTVSGTAKDTLAYGIASIILGGHMALAGIYGGLITVWHLVDSLHQGGDGFWRREHGFMGLFVALAGISLPIGVGLLFAGILAIRARSQYKAWRRGGTQASPSSGADRELDAE
jgi:hypothetical protein